jgi:hypothetical protein
MWLGWVEKLEVPDPRQQLHATNPPESFRLVGIDQCVVAAVDQSGIRSWGGEPSGSSRRNYLLQ